ncbi:hypothetical protein LZ30DRAFT_705303 [Colletotrichum cereale]|nr:hypothetical protein LZ30DRAFT_705303 [Colletotrichum cereale]
MSSQVSASRRRAQRQCGCGCAVRRLTCVGRGEGGNGTTDRQPRQGQPTATPGRYSSTSPRRTGDANGICGLARLSLEARGTTWRPGGFHGMWELGCAGWFPYQEARCCNNGGRGRGTGTAREQARRRHDGCSGQILHVWSETCAATIERERVLMADHG